MQIVLQRSIISGLLGIQLYTHIMERWLVPYMSRNLKYPILFPAITAYPEFPGSHPGIVWGNPDPNCPPWPGTIVTICMSHFITGDIGKEHRTNKPHQPEEFRKGQKMSHVLLTSQSPSCWNPSWLSNQSGCHWEGSWVRTEEEKLKFYVTSCSFCLCNSAFSLQSLDHVGHIVSEKWGLNNTKNWSSSHLPLSCSLQLPGLANLLNHACPCKGQASPSPSWLLFLCMKPLSLNQPINS